jgi:prepilin-type N-terminal cleavage/methylation domain-containing protein
METYMNTRSSSSRRPAAFTLIELLVVIAIIAILAAILFPIFGTVRENARQSSTMSNMHTIYVNAKVFNEDEGHFPNALFGYVTTPSGLASPNPPEVPASSATPPSNYLPIDQTTNDFTTNSVNIGDASPGSKYVARNRGFLYPEQIKDYRAFLCEDNLVETKNSGTKVYWPINSPISIRAGGSLTNRIEVDWTQSDSSVSPKIYGDRDLPNPAYKDTPKLYYAMDSMDIGPTLNVNGQPVDCKGNVVSKGNPGGFCYELHYSPDWSHRLGSVDDVDPANNTVPVVTQLKYKYPPSERTVLTYITHHAALGSPQILVLLLSGTARKIAPRDAYQFLPTNYR